MGDSGEIIKHGADSKTSEMQIYRQELLKELRGSIDNGNRSARVDLKMLEYFAAARALRIRKNADYGDSWRALGARGLFVRLTDKVGRLKSLLWDNRTQQVADESLRDTASDLINYGLFLLYALDHGMIDGDNKDA
jgi:hypothetical protein